MPTIRYPTLRRASSAFAIALFLLTSCSYVFEVTMEIQIDEAVDLSEGSLVVVFDEQLTAIDEAPATPEGLFASTVIELGPERSYTATGQTCCAPQETVLIYAYVDVDGDGQYDPGEPFGADPDNPVVVDDDRRSTIVIRPAD